jgi:hypothetical protein
MSLLESDLIEVLGEVLGTADDAFSATALSWEDVTHRLDQYSVNFEVRTFRDGRLRGVVRC